MRVVREKPLIWRYWGIIAILLIAGAGLVWRMIYLTVLNREFLQEQGNARTLRVINVPAYRGMIRDRNGEPLAISTPVDAVWINPQAFNVDTPGVTQLASLLELPVGDIRQRAAKNKTREFVYLKRGIDPTLGQRVASLKIPGVFLQREYRRFYPEGEVAAHLLGFTNIDDKGQEGLELAYNQWLAGVPGRKQVIKDRLGHTVAEVKTLRVPHPGHDLVLSIDRRIQYLAYRELKAGLQQFQAKSGSAIVLDVKTGEVLAMVNQPSYNPNNRAAKRDSSYRNRAATDVFEPGSTIKTFSIVNALVSGKYQPDSKIDISPGRMVVDNRVVRDEHYHGHGIIDLSTILAVSSNVGVAKATLSLPPEQFYEVLHAVGFGELTESNFPGESAGVLDKEHFWQPFILATMSFGYGMSATLLQLAQAYGILANNGVKNPISLVRLDSSPKSVQVLEPLVAQQALSMLESVIRQGGTAPLAKVPGYRVTGKTGTSRLLNEKDGGYHKDRHNGTFVGIAPASNPRLLVAVWMHDPRGKQYYAGAIAAPIFAKIMGDALRLMNVPPDEVGPAKI